MQFSLELPFISTKVASAISGNLTCIGFSVTRTLRSDWNRWTVAGVKSGLPHSSTDFLFESFSNKGCPTFPARYAADVRRVEVELLRNPFVNTAEHDNCPQ
jgi:hypothetical protein